VAPSSSDERPEGRRLILTMAASLDGFLAFPDHRIDWQEDDSDPASSAAGAARHSANLELIGQAGLIVLGRRAFDDMAPAWSSSDSPMARLINSLPKLVFSSTPPETEWVNSAYSARPLAEHITELKREEGRDVVCFGGAKLAHSLAREQLIDEYRLTVHPVALGDGLPLWHGLPEPQRFNSISTSTYADGSVTHRLVPVVRST
jgi:dihydrofolate reductase